jgi:hypothetical protein
MFEGNDKEMKMQGTPFRIEDSEFHRAQKSGTCDIDRSDISRAENAIEPWL